MTIERLNVHEPPLPFVPTFIGVCCREWVLALGFRGRCGLCGEIPTYVRRDQ